MPFSQRRKICRLRFFRWVERTKDYGCWLATRAVLSELQRQGKPVKQIDDPFVVTSGDPEGTDKDLLALMKLAIGWHYPVARVKARPLH